MDHNVGGFDVLRRIVAGVLLSSMGMVTLLESGIGVAPFAILFGSLLGVASLAIGGYLLATAGLRWCPVNARLGYDTSASG